jgi:RNA polymerase sigma-70 factor (ECF subfamily)
MDRDSDSDSDSAPPAGRPSTIRRDSGHKFEDVYRAHFRLVWRTLARLGVREADLMDVSQNVFLVVHRQLAGFEGRAELTTWLFSICRLVAKDYRRSAPICREVSVDARQLDQRDGRAESALQRLDTRDLSQLLEAILSRMPEKLSLVFVLFELDEMSGEEIARLLDIPVGTARSRLRLAREAFQREVHALGGPQDAGPLGTARVARPEEA